MKSVTKLSFSKTHLSKEGIGAVACFPNLKRLQIDWSWQGADLTPLCGQQSLETLALDGYDAPIPPEWIAVMASMPKLKEVVVDDDDDEATVVRQLKKAAPHVEVQRWK